MPFENCQGLDPKWEILGAMERADGWRDKGNHFAWSPRGGNAAEVQVFHIELGDAGAPPLVLVHGFPTSSIDWFEVANRLSDRYRVCAMDFPGYGFSDKPLGWGYSLTRDAELLEHYVAEVLGLDSMTMLAHDRGSSVATIHTTSHESRVGLDHLFITNGNIFLPLSNLTRAQRLMLDPETGPALLAQTTPEQLAMGIGQTTYTPPRGADDPEIQALTAVFAHDEGVRVLHETIQYLVERVQDEESWLKALAELEVPTTFIWGLDDRVSPPRVMSYVWDEYMMKKPGPNSLYFIPGANHYLQNDQPEALVDTVLHSLDAPPDTPPGAIGQGLASPLLVDRSRSELPQAADLLKHPAQASV
jgi:pimeloyl-ACP methyl ester carboxylesterase